MATATAQLPPATAAQRIEELGRIIMAYSEVTEKLKPLERENREHHSSFWRAEALFTKALSCLVTSIVVCEREGGADAL